MSQIAYRFVPWDDDGRPRANSEYTTVAEDTDGVGVGTVIDADIFGYQHWKVVEVQQETATLLAVTDADGITVPIGGTLICRGVE